MKKPLFLMFLLAFLIRLISLDQSFWLDEATSAKVVQQYGFQRILTDFSPHDFHPPLYYLTLKFWTNIFGYSEIVLRIPSVLFSLLSGWFIFLIGKKLKNNQVGFWAAVFFLFNPLIIYYSQEARMYMMVTFLLTAAFYYYFQTETYSSSGVEKINKFSTGSNNNIFLTNLLFFLAFLTFYGSIFLIISFYIYLFYKKRYRSLFLLLPGFVLGLLLASPLLYQQFTNSQFILLQVKNWSLVLGQANVKNLLLIPIKFSFGRISFEPKPIYYALSGVWTAMVFWFAYRGAKPKNQLLLSLFALPIVLGFIFSFFMPLLQYFRFLYLIPFLTLLMAFGTNINWQKILISAVFIILSFVYLLVPQFHREDWKGLVKNLPEDEKIYMILSSSDPVLYYDDRLSLNDLKNTNEITGDIRRIIIIPYTIEIHGIDYRSSMQKQKFHLQNTVIYRGLTVEYWYR